MRLLDSQLSLENESGGSFPGASKGRVKGPAEDIDATRILLVEHRSSFCDSMNEALQQRGLLIDTARGTNAMETPALARDYSLVLLNSMQLGAAGLSAVQSIRRKTNAPLLVLTERDSVALRLAGLELGASDYLVKPFTMPQLLARIRALARNSVARPQPILWLDDLEINERDATCSRDGKDLGLTRMEFVLLLALLRNQGRVMSRETLAREVWGTEFDPATNAINVAILRLRNKVDAPFDVKLLHTVRGKGYVLELRSGS
ncbi:winged helix-turn-helix domain-containing protein [Variovorax sp. 278MFTsu5.1]|uniref:winged helix-turn-helix domain-containing protein n=1 Tax=Variovorax sp. 278MFTsu5.1 TaxID=3158366 RepID=UPI003AAF37DD